MIRWDCVEWMPVGAKTLANRAVVVAHEEEMLLDPFADLQMLTNTDIPRRRGEIEIERITEGWLIDGVLFRETCWGPCHSS